MLHIVIRLVSKRSENDQLWESLLRFLTNSFEDLNFTTILDEESSLYGGKTLVLIQLHDMFEVTWTIDKPSDEHSAIIYGVPENEDAAKGCNFPPSSVVCATSIRKWKHHSGECQSTILPLSIFLL